ncbi:MAG: L-fucose/L-arabinose isomerase family protein [Chloroflexota bacterium]|nr:L-fucose/L-arabinose isomerase family protein [Chloroflexota bacterium]
MSGTTRLGVFGIGLAAYWPQFEGLKAAIEQHLAHIEDRVGAWGTVVSAGVVDTAESGACAGDRFAAERVDLLLCYAGTYATSTQVLPVAQRAGVPVILLNLQPEVALDYETVDTRGWLENCGVCPIPELAGVFQRTGVPYRIITGHLHSDEVAWGEIEAWCRVVAAARTLQRGRFGMLGHTYPGMIDMSTDVGIVAGQLGAHVEILEMEDLRDRVRSKGYKRVPEIEVTARRRFAIFDNISHQALVSATRIAGALCSLVDDYALDGLAYYYRGSGGDEIEQLASNMILGNTLLTTDGIPAAGEGDLKTALAMKLMHGLGAGGSFTEFAAMDFHENFFLMGHDGPAHLGISDGEAVLKSLAVFHGKAGGGLAVEMRAQTGPVTVLGMTQTRDGRLKLVAAEGESLPGPVPRIGNSLHRIRFGGDLRGWFEAWCATGPTHHVALGLGHRRSDIEKAAWLLGLELDVVRAQ